MRLLDAVQQAREPLLLELPDGARFSLPGAANLSPTLRATPLRYVLDDTVAAFAARFAFLESERLVACLDLLRLPGPRLWIEWNDAARADAMHEAGFEQACARKRQCGLLVTGDESGRRGAIQFAWMNDAGAPDLSPIVVDFDFDDPSFGCRAGEGGELVIGVSMSGCPPLETLYRHTRFRLRREWLSFYRAQALGEAVERRYLEANLEHVAADFPFVGAFALLLLAGNAVAVAPVAFDRLNRKRARRQKPALLDYLEVLARLDAAAGAGAGGSGDERAQARLHFVSGHLVRRGQKVFWRRAHLRGDAARGTVLGGNMSVRMGAQPAR